MTDEETRPRGVGAGSSRPGGPGSILAFWADICDCSEATAWRMLCESEHIVDLLANWSEWDRRRGQRDVSNAFSVPDREYWRLRAGAPTYTEIQRRRDHYDRPPRTAAQLLAEARWSWFGRAA